MLDRLWRLVRALLAGGAATLVDLAALTLLVSGAHVDPRVANVPALLAGGVVQFVANRGFVFRARDGALGRQLALFALVEGVALGLNGVLYDLALRAAPSAAQAYPLVRIVTSHAVFLAWSLPLWHVVFRGARAPAPARETR